MGAQDGQAGQEAGAPGGARVNFVVETAVFVGAGEEAGGVGGGQEAAEAVVGVGEVGGGIGVVDGLQIPGGRVAVGGGEAGGPWGQADRC